MPYFRCREFPANFALCEKEKLKDNDDVPEKDFGLMLFDMDYSDKISVNVFSGGYEAWSYEFAELRGDTMILQALAKYYENLAEEKKVPKPGWCSAKVSYQINLSEEGDVKGIISLKTEEEQGKENSSSSSSTAKYQR